MIVAIDGPAGAGKSTTARALAERFGWAYIDTGAMYRAVALAAREAGLQAPQDAEAIAELAHALPIALRDNGRSVFIGERDVSGEIRTPLAAELASQVAALPGVRQAMAAQQRRLGLSSELECGGAVLEGRDIQTVVFPDAPVKIFLTAGLQTRAARRIGEWQQKDGPQAQGVSLDEAQAQLSSRDSRDSKREAAPLLAAPDAVLVETDDASPAEVVERIARLVSAAQDKALTPHASP